MNLNTELQKNNSYDAIVVGTGISGGWAAKELTEKGLKTLVLERGRMVTHPDYPTATKDPWELKHRGRITKETAEQNPLISKASGYGEDDQQFFIVCAAACFDDTAHSVTAPMTSGEMIRLLLKDGNKGVVMLPDSFVVKSH